MVHSSIFVLSSISFLFSLKEKPYAEKLGGFKKVSERENDKVTCAMKRAKVHIVKQKESMLPLCNN